MAASKQPTSNMKLIVGFIAGLGVATIGVIVWNLFFKRASITGVVTDAGTDLPLEGVTVTLRGDEGLEMVSVTDAKGQYTFTNGPKTSYNYQGYVYNYFYDLTFQKTGYWPQLLNQLVMHPAVNTFDITMEPI